MPGGVKDGGTSAKNGGEGAKEWGAGEMWECPEVWRMGEGVQRMGCWGEVGVLGGVKDGGRGENGVFRDVKNGSGAW